MQTRILIVDDHIAIRAGIKQIVSAGFPAVEFGEAGQGEEALKQLKDSGWAIVLLDIDLPDTTGFEVLMRMHDESITTPVLVFSFHKEEQIVKRALKCGAAGYITKDDASDLLPAIKRILVGETGVLSSLLQSGK